MLTRVMGLRQAGLSLVASPMFSAAQGSVVSVVSVVLASFALLVEPPLLAHLVIAARSVSLILKKAARKVLAVRTYL